MTKSNELEQAVSFTSLISHENPKIIPEYIFQMVSEF